MSLCGNGLTLMKMTKFFKREENTVEKEKLLVSSNFFLFPTEFPKDLYCRHIGTRASLGKG